MKLSERQKKIIKRMQSGETIEVLIPSGNKRQKYFIGKDLKPTQRRQIIDLWDEKLVEVKHVNAFKNEFHLTKLGRSITVAILLFLSSYTTKAQLTRDEDRVNYPVVGFHVGYDIKICAPIAGLQFGYKAGNIFTSVNTVIPVTSNSLAPKMIIGNVGYNIGSFQPFVSYGYHFIGKVAEQYFRHTVDAYTSGFHFGIGVSYYPVNLPLQFSIQKQGKEIISSLTLYKAL